MANKVKTGILFFIFAVLLLPLVQKSLPFIKSKGLDGEFIIAADTVFTPRGWFDGSYWNKKSRYLNDNMGLRPDIIRLNNEIDYDLFGKIHSEWRLFCENNCVFQDMYIYSYLGRDYNGYPYIHEKVRKLKAIQDTLARLGKFLVFVQSPCKAFYYPENFPGEFKDTAHGPTNYATYTRLADSMGLNLIDFNKWFVSMKDTSKELLYPKQGLHWSVYGSWLAADSLTRYIERQRHISMIHPYWDTLIHTQKPRFTDDDITKTMNLIFPVTTETFTYPAIKYKGAKNSTKPDVIYIGDSFFFPWMYQGYLDSTNGNWQLWYYYNVLVNRYVPMSSWHMLDDNYCIDQINKTDGIVVMFTSRNLDKLAKDFVEKTYDHFYPVQKSVAQ